MGDLRTNIMNLKADPEMLETLGRGRSADYKLGFKDARHAAAEQAALDAAEARAVVKPLVFAIEDDNPKLSVAPCVFGHYVTNAYYGHVELLVGYGRGSMVMLKRIEERGASRERLEESAQTDFSARILSALPLEATHAELLAAAAELAEVRALVDAACVIKYRRENRCSGSVNSTAAVDALIEALAPFARKGGV